MILKLRKTLLVSTFFILALIGQACGVAPGPATSSPTALPTDLQPSATAPSTMAATPLPNDAAAPRVVPAPTLIFTPTPAPVSITAVNGDLGIHTGPAPVFDAIAVLKAGQTLPVYARSIQDGWVQVPVPGQPGKLGWVSTNTGFSKVDGYVLDLPLITKVEWPFGAYLRNCTAHQVIVEPGDTIVPPVSAAPANKVWFTPGLYTVYDNDVSGRPEITQVKLWQHTSINLVKDGAGAKYSCP